ncbi:IclR family transcriptional regulator [Deinococcus maricopensis]|uniref:Transcriptional regulator, IclR family n=1 Tax=Deinococcus maricopensis (strain DSM 21211 / LMG 22137 / NRRL B-23946 / LB-34) TaxID=709986 RepID=E8U536_DEIML|nr:IclR family transcriptional regulator [Deinococcus maricopensis]ADV66175.1 transcriptional regulator, IclR family [Deinococcus maricopensis DSM 21211]
MQSLRKASEVLRAFSAAQPEWGARALAAHLGVPRATAHAYLTGLAEAGFLRRTPRGQYRLSWHLAEFGAQLTATLPWFPAARGALADLASSTRALGFLCVLEDDRVVCINRALGDPDADQAQIQTDVTLPANATAAGKLLYAHANLPTPTFEPYTASTITTPDEWAGELARVRADGYAHAIEEWVPGHCALGVPLRWEGEVVAAFGVQLPTARFLARERRLLDRVQGAARSAGFAASS